MNHLYIVGTPIGNLGDITLRALEMLKGVDFILCEDTRTTKKLLTKYDIGTKTISYHMHSKISKVAEIIGLLKEGKNLALVSDAGTPGISDPGAELVATIRKEYLRELEKGELRIEPVPGPSALIAALSIAGVPCASFTFLGFLPRKKGRKTLFEEIAVSDKTIVFYESPHRIMKTFESLAECSTLNEISIKSGLKRITVCRELTKVFEEVVSGSAVEVKKYFESRPDKIRGEFVVIVSK